MEGQFFRKERIFNFLVCLEREFRRLSEYYKETLCSTSFGFWKLPAEKLTSILEMDEEVKYN